MSLLSIKGVADRLSVSADAVYRLVSAGKLPHYRIGGAIRVSEIQLADFLEGAEKRDRPARDTSRPVKLEFIEIRGTRPPRRPGRPPRAVPPGA